MAGAVEQGHQHRDVLAGHGGADKGGRLHEPERHDAGVSCGFPSTCHCRTRSHVARRRRCGARVRCWYRANAMTQEASLRAAAPSGVTLSAKTSKSPTSTVMTSWCWSARRPRTHASCVTRGTAGGNQMVGMVHERVAEQRHRAGRRPLLATARLPGWTARRELRVAGEPGRRLVGCPVRPVTGPHIAYFSLHERGGP